MHGRLGDQALAELDRATVAQGVPRRRALVLLEVQSPPACCPDASRSRSVHGTLNHLLLAERLWYLRLTGGSTQGLDQYWGGLTEVVSSHDEINS